MLYNYIPISIQSIFIKADTTFTSNSNYFIKISKKIKYNILTVHKFIIEIENEIFWKKYLVEIGETDSKYNYIFKERDEYYVSSKFLRHTLHYHNSIVIIDSKEQQIENIIVLEASQEGDCTKISIFSSVNNSFSIIYFK